MLKKQNKETTTVDSIDHDRASVMEKVRLLRDLIEQSADTHDEKDCLDDEVIEALDSTRMLALMAPRELGGAEADPLTLIEAIKTLSYYDGSTGWYAAAVMTGAAVAGVFLGDRAVEEIFADGKPWCAGQAAPTGKAEKVGDSYRVQGSYSFGSGTPSAKWIVGGYILHENGKPVMLENGAPRMLIAMVPRDKVAFRGNWNVLGLRGTASFDFHVPEQLVHEDFVFDTSCAQPRRGGALYRMGFLALPCIHHGSVPLGVTSRMLDEWAEFARTKVRGPGLYANQLQTLQRDLAAGQGEIRAAEAYMQRTFSDLFAAASQGEIPPQLKIDGRLAASTANNLGARITHTAYASCTTTALRNGSRLQRCFRDMQASTAHFVTAEQSLIDVGRVLAGVPEAEINF